MNVRLSICRLSWTPGALVVLGCVLLLAPAAQARAETARPVLPTPQSAKRPAARPIERKPALPKPPAVPVLPAQNFETDTKVVSAELDELIREALKINPELIAQRERARAASARIGPAGMPADPAIGFNLKDMPTTFDFTRENATEKQIIAQLTYPFPGKLTLRRAVATDQAGVTREEMHAATLALITAVRSAFADVFVADKDIQLALEDRARFSDFVDIATSKYRVGPGLQQDVLNADVAVARIDSELLVLQRRRLSREIQLATLLDRQSVHVPPLGALPPLALLHSELELEQLAQVTNPAILAAQRAVEREEKAYALARKSVLPDFALQVIYGSRNDFTHPETGRPDTVRPDLVSGEILMTVPLYYFSKQREEIREAAANLARSRALLAARRRAVVNGVHDFYARLVQHRAVAASLHDEVIPLARTNVSASISAYQVDQVDFLTLLEAENKLDQYRAEYWREEAEIFRSVAQLQELSGALLVGEGWR